MFQEQIRNLRRKPDLCNLGNKSKAGNSFEQQKDQSLLMKGKIPILIAALNIIYPHYLTQIQGSISFQIPNGHIYCNCVDFANFQLKYYAFSENLTIQLKAWGSNWCVAKMSGIITLTPGSNIIIVVAVQCLCIDTHLMPQ